LDGDLSAPIGFADILAGFERVHWDKDGGECYGGIGAFERLCGAPSLAHSRLVVGNNEGGAVEKGVGEDRGAHAGDGVVLVGGFGRVRYADA